MVYPYSIGDILNLWGDMGVFAYLLPFLMIFAMVYGILSRTEVLGKNKGVNVTIALAFGLLALQFDYVTSFYATIFPYAGMGLAVLLVAMIFLGLSAEEKLKGKIWWGITMIIFLVILFTSFSGMFWVGDAIGLVEALPALLAVGAVVGIIIAITKGG